MYDMFSLAAGTCCLISADSAEPRKVTAFVFYLALPVGTSTNTNKRLHGKKGNVLYASQ